VPGAIHDQELVLEEERLRNYGTGATRSEQAGQGSDEVDEKNDQIAHHRIVAGRGILRNLGRNNNSPATGSTARIIHSGDRAQAINELIQEMIALLRGEASRHSILIHSDIALDLPTITADRVQIQQVFMNLMLNGIEAMKNMNTPGNLTVRSQRDDSGQLLISVMDTGVGVPAEKMDQIFNPFFTSKPEGTGMGLPISRSIIESHGGRLWAVSNPESGSIFRFTLPIERTAHQAA